MESIFNQEKNKFDFYLGQAETLYISKEKSFVGLALESQCSVLVVDLSGSVLAIALNLFNQQS